MGKEAASKGTGMITSALYDIAFCSFWTFRTLSYTHDNCNSGDHFPVRPSAGRHDEPRCAEERHVDKEPERRDETILPRIKFWVRHQMQQACSFDVTRYGVPSKRLQCSNLHRVQVVARDAAPRYPHRRIDCGRIERKRAPARDAASYARPRRSVRACIRRQNFLPLSARGQGPAGRVFPVEILLVDQILGVGVNGDHHGPSKHVPWSLKAACLVQ
jgi:hypothetical protein